MPVPPKTEVLLCCPVSEQPEGGKFVTPWQDVSVKRLKSAEMTPNSTREY